MFMLWAVDATIVPTIIKLAPKIATLRRPIKSDIEPTKGQTAANARRFAITNQTYRSSPPMSL